MKINKKALELIEKGLSSKTVSKLDESQINVLHSRLISEVLTQTTTSYTITPDELKKGVALPQQPAGKSIALKQTPQGTIKATPNEGEMKETETDDLTDNNALGADALQSVTGQEAPHDANDQAPDGMDDDSDDDRKMMGMSESEKEPKKNEPNPWAICHSQVGPKKSRKWERCVRAVKKQLAEGKNPVSLFLENQIMKIVEKNLPPRITKGDLVKYLSEGENFATKHLTDWGKTKGNSPAVAPTKPKTSPTTKPGTKPSKPAHPGKNPNPGEQPAPKAKKEVDEQNPAVAPTKPTTKPGTKPGTKPSKPAHPGKNPNPGEQPAPKAKKISPEAAKEEVIDVIIKMLEK